MRQFKPSESILIRAGRKKSGDLIIESEPGANTNSNRALLLPSLNSAVVHVNEVTGDDGTGDGSQGNPFKTYAKAVTEIDASGGSLTHIEWQINNLHEDIIKPTQAALGIAPLLGPTGQTWTARTNTFGSDTINGVTFGDGLFVAVGNSGKTSTSPDGITWTARTNTFGTDLILAVTFGTNLFVAVGDLGKLSTSPDGITWTARTSAFGTTRINGVTFGDGLFVAVGNSGKTSTSPDGITWTARTNTFGASTIRGVTFGTNLFVAVGLSGKTSTSPDGITWTARTNTFGASTIGTVTFGDGLFVAGGSAGKTSTSPDGITWTARTNTFGADFIATIAFGNSLFIAGGVNGKTSTSPDGITWTAQTNTFGTNSINGIISDLSIFVAVGAANNTSTSSVIAIQDDLCGFSLTELVTISTSDIELKNVTSNQIEIGLTVTVPIILTAVRIESDNNTALDITANSFTIVDSLFVAQTDNFFTLDITSIQVGSQDVIINQCTMIGDVNNDNIGSIAEGTQYRDNLTEGDVISTEATDLFTIESGNVRGAITNALVSNRVSTTDPLFADAIDWQLQREVNGFDFDSPLVGASVFGVRLDGLPRDLGAWNIDDSQIVFVFSLAKDIPKPSQPNAIETIINNRANLQIAVSGSPTVFNDPTRRLEQLVLRYGSVTEDIINFVDFIERQIDTTVFISFNEGFIVLPTLVVDGNQSAGTPVINIQANSIFNGARMTIAGKVYTLIYPIPLSGLATSLVLDRILEDDISDLDTISVSFPIGEGEFIYVPQQNRRTSRKSAQEQEYVSGLNLTFVRKAP